MKKNKLNKKRIISIISSVVLLSLIIVGSKYWQMQRLAKRFESGREKQMQIMKDFWQAKGLSEEEIEERINNQGSGRNAGEITNTMRAVREEKLKNSAINPEAMKANFRMMH